MLKEIRAIITFLLVIDGGNISKGKNQHKNDNGDTASFR